MIGLAVPAGGWTATPNETTPSTAPETQPLTLGERGATAVNVIWTAKALTVLVSSYGEEVPPQLMCNGVVAGDNPQAVDLSPDGELDVSCDGLSGLSFRISLPGVERDGPSFVLNQAALDAFEQCQLTSPPAMPTLVDRIFPAYSVRFVCPLSLATVSFEPADFDFVTDQLVVDACPAVGGLPCPDSARVDA